MLLVYFRQICIVFNDQTEIIYKYLKQLKQVFYSLFNALNFLNIIPLLGYIQLISNKKNLMVKVTLFLILDY